MSARATAALAMLVLTLESARATQMSFGFSSVGLSYPFAAAIAKGFQDAAAQAGVHAIILDAQGRVQKQANDIDDLIGQKVSGIALMPLDSVVAQSWVERAATAGIPVVAVGSQVGDPRTRALQDVYPKLVALVTQDEVAAGREAGQLAARLLPRDRTANIAIIEGAPGFAEVLQRASGFRAALDASHVSYRIVASQPGDWTADKADVTCQNILAGHPDVDLFFNEADDMAVGCAHAVRAVGAHAKLVGIGGSKLAVVSIKAGRVDGTVCYKPEELGALAFAALYDDVTGRKPLHGGFITYHTPGVTRADIGQCIGQW
jgi:ribose transport system substrate-binding protein